MPYQKLTFQNQYENYIGGEWMPPVDGEYFDDISLACVLRQFQGYLRMTSLTT